MPATPALLTVEEAAARLGMTVDELMFSRARGLPPGTLGYREDPYGPLVWKRDDLLPAPPEKLRAMADMVKQIAENTNQCVDCGFQAKSKGGLAAHRRVHDR